MQAYNSIWCQKTVLKQHIFNYKMQILSKYRSLSTWFYNFPFRLPDKLPDCGRKFFPGQIFRTLITACQRHYTQSLLSFAPFYYIEVIFCLPGWSEWKMLTIQSFTQCLNQENMTWQAINALSERQSKSGRILQYGNLSQASLQALAGLFHCGCPMGW